VSAFPVTDWQRLERLKTGDERERTAVLGELFVRYRAPVLGYLSGRGMSPERAEDLLQDFFVFVVEENFFAQADANRGRFRNLLLTALQRYGARQHRAAQAQRRRPEGGFAAADVGDLPEGALPAAGDTPERVFVRRWAETLVRRVLAALEAEFAGAERRAHREIFRRLVVAPILEGAAAPSQRELAEELGLTEKEVANRLVTVRRAYQRLLRTEIATYARDDAEVDAEVRELFAQLAHA
jgi:RNA polymerase sigma-70 factor (ECF subfamily)